MASSMDRVRRNIAIIEPSDTIYEGVSTLLMKSGNHFHLSRLNDLNEFCSVIQKRDLQVVLLNPVCVMNRLTEFDKLRTSYPGITWIGLVYSYFDDALLSRFSKIFSILDRVEQLESMINSQFDQVNPNHGWQEQLSERERDVLIHLIRGHSNKEIAEELNISIHTVNSHRRNIIEKTGIKSLSGLTIYAISMNIIPLDTSYI